MVRHQKIRAVSEICKNRSRVRTTDVRQLVRQWRLGKEKPSGQNGKKLSECHFKSCSISPLRTKPLRKSHTVSRLEHLGSHSKESCFSKWCEISWLKQMLREPAMPTPATTIPTFVINGILVPKLNFDFQINETTVQDANNNVLTILVSHSLVSPRNSVF